MPRHRAEPVLGAGRLENHPIALAGGTTTTLAYTHDAFLDDVIAAATGQGVPISVDITVTGAILTARGYVPSQNTGEVSFWVEDMSGAVFGFYLDVLAAGGIDPVDLAPGDAVTMHVIEVQEYFGVMEITEIDSLTVDSADNSVHVLDGMTGSSLEVLAEVGQMVEVYGELVSIPTDCGGDDCFDLDYGSGVSATLRTTAGLQLMGDCIHWIGPYGEFNGDAQLGADNLDWYRWW